MKFTKKWSYFRKYSHWTLAGSRNTKKSISIQSWSTSFSCTLVPFLLSACTIAARAWLRTQVYWEFWPRSYKTSHRYQRHTALCIKLAENVLCTTLNTLNDWKPHLHWLVLYKQQHVRKFWWQKVSDFLLMIRCAAHTLRKRNRSTFKRPKWKLLQVISSFSLGYALRIILSVRSRPSVWP